MVTPTGQTASLHHAAKVHWALCASHELEVCVAEQDHSTGDSAAATSRSRQQAESCSGCPCPLCGSDSLLDADEPVPSVSRATSDVQRNVCRPSTSGTPSVSHAAARLRSTGAASHAGSNATSSICAFAELVRASHHEGWSPTCLYDRPEQQHPAYHPTSCQSPGPQCSYSAATKPGLLPATPRGLRGQQWSATTRKPCQRQPAQQGFHSHPRGWCPWWRGVCGPESMALSHTMVSQFDLRFSFLFFLFFLKKRKLAIFVIPLGHGKSHLKLRRRRTQGVAIKIVYFAFLCSCLRSRGSLSVFYLFAPPAVFLGSCTMNAQIGCTCDSGQFESRPKCGQSSAVAGKSSLCSLVRCMHVWMTVDSSYNS